LFEPLKQHLGSRRFHKNEEAEMKGWECNSPIYTATGFLNSFQEGTSASVCSGINLKNNDNLVE
jgi:hypothetical protein